MAAFIEGQQYRNPKTGQMLLRKDGGWVKAPNGGGMAPAKAVTGAQYPTLLPAEYRPGVTPAQNILEPNAEANPIERPPDSTYSSVPPSVAQGSGKAREEYDKKMAQWSGERDAKFLDRTRENSLNAAMILPTLDDVESLIERAPVGAYAGIVEGVGRFIPGVTEDDDLQAIRSKMNKIILPLTSLLKGTLSDKDMQFLQDTLGSTSSSRGAMLENIKLARREARAAIIKQRELQRWIQLKGNPSTPDSEGRTFEDAWQEYFRDPATLKDLDRPGERVKSRQPKNAPLQLYRDREGRIRSR